MDKKKLGFEQEPVAGVFLDDEDAELVARMREKVDRIRGGPVDPLKNIKRSPEWAREQEAKRDEEEKRKDLLVAKVRAGKRAAYSLPFALGTILLVLKAFGGLDIGWVWILAPFWMPVIIVLWGALFAMTGRSGES